MARPLAALLLATAFALAGCTASEDDGVGGGSGDGAGGTTTVGGGTTGGSGSASAFLKDAPADDFAELHVMVTAACVHRSGSDGATTTVGTTTTGVGNGTTTGNGTAGNGTGNLTTSATTTSATTTTAGTTADGTGSGRADPCIGPSQQGQGRQGGAGAGSLGTCAAGAATTTTTAATAAGNGTTTGNGTANGTATATSSTTGGQATTTAPGASVVGTTTANGWIVLFSDPAGLDVDLLATTGARAAFLGESSLAAGSYQQVRIEVCAAWGITHEGGNVTIEVASGTLRSVRGFTVADGQESRITVDLDLERSLREQGNGQWRLTPVVGKTTVATIADGSSGDETADPGDVVPVPEAGDGSAAASTSAAGTTTDPGNATASSTTTTSGTP